MYCVIQGYPGTTAPAGFGPTSGHPYPGMIRPNTPGPASGMPPMPSRQSTPTPSSIPPAAGPGPATPAAPVAGAPIQPAPYPPYGQPGQPPSQQPRQPTFGEFDWLEELCCCMVPCLQLDNFFGIFTFR